MEENKYGCVKFVFIDEDKKQESEIIEIKKRGKVKKEKDCVEPRMYSIHYTLFMLKNMFKYLSSR